MTTFARFLSDAFLLWLSRWMWRVGTAERAMRRDIRELAEAGETEGTA